jgi:hypothetical protein
MGFQDSAAIRQREGQYLVGTPRSQMKEFELYLKEETHWEKVREEVRVKLISIPGGTETFLLRKTECRQQKSRRSEIVFRRASRKP